MDHHVNDFHQVARRRSPAHSARPMLSLVGELALSVVMAPVAILLLLSGHWLGIVLGVLMILAAPALVVAGIQQYRLALRARGLPPDGRGLPMVEGPLRWVRRANSDDCLDVGDQRFILGKSAGLGRQLRKFRREPGPMTARAWFVSGSDMTDPVLVRLDARPRTEAELLGDLTELERRFHTAAHAVDVRWDRYADFIAELPALKAGFASGAPAEARASAARRFAHFQEKLGPRGQEQQELGEVSGPVRAMSVPVPPRPPLPAQVRWSFRLWKAVAVLGLIPLVIVLVVIVYGIPVRAPADQPVLLGIAVLAVVTAFACSILYFARRMLAGRRRARVAVGIVGGIWGLLLFSVALSSATADDSVVWAVLALAQVLAIVAAIVLMYLPDADRYFR